ncbi:hypothetical protein [Spirillospora sp. NPDC047279]|uniref:hypothetical protein n=1 Tax=Spirillospora sp. NPDC047279 TaxID=3155478 RepID=UPI0033CDE3B3
MSNVASVLGLLVLTVLAAAWGVVQIADLRFWAGPAWSAQRPGPPGGTTRPSPLASPFARAALRLGVGLAGWALGFGIMIVLPADADWVLAENLMGAWLAVGLFSACLLVGASITHSVLAGLRRLSVVRGWAACGVLLVHALALSGTARLVSAAKVDDLGDDPLIAFWLIVAFLPLLAVTLPGLHFGSTAGRTALAVYLAFLVSWALRCLVLVLSTAGTLQVDADVVTLLLVELTVISLGYLWARRFGPRAAGSTAGARPAARSRPVAR